MLVLSGCVSVEAELSEVEVTRQGLEMDGSVVPLELGEVALTTSFDHPYEGFEIPENVRSELRPTGASLRAGAAVADLSFLSGFEVVIGSRDPSAPPPAVVFEYRRVGADAVGPLIEVVPVDRPNVLDYWKTGAAYYELTVIGELPEEKWSVDVSVQFSGQVQLSM